MRMDRSDYITKHRTDKSSRLHLAEPTARAQCFETKQSCSSYVTRPRWLSLRRRKRSPKAYSATVAQAVQDIALGRLFSLRWNLVVIQLRGKLGQFAGLVHGLTAFSL